MPDAFLHEILRTRKELAAAVLRFNAPTAADFAPDALPETAQRLLREGILTRLEGSRAGRVMVRVYLLRLSESGRAPLFLDFREERRRLALLPRETLGRLAGFFGACVYAPEASRCVRRDEVLSLRAALGPDYDHILTRGRFQLAESRTRFADLLPKSSLPARMRVAGFAALRLCFSDWPPSLLRLAGPRLPEELRAGPGLTPPMPVAALPVIWLDVKKLLLKEVAPQWQACFE